jgi:hypothetical protein
MPRGALLLTATMVGAVPTAVMGQTQYRTDPHAPSLHRPDETQERGGSTPPSTEGHAGTSTPPPGGSPSDKLSRSHGVIEPPPTGDRGVIAPRPDQSRTPVVPPPGTPGGNPEVQPK